MRRGFTLLEVVIALLVLEVAVVGLVGTLALASSTLSRADVLERAAAAADGVLDSLARRPAGPGSDSMVHAAGAVRWTVDDSGRVVVRATDPSGRVLVDVRSVLLPTW